MKYKANFQTVGFSPEAKKLYQFEKDIRLSVLVLSVQFVLWGSILLDYIGIQIPIIRQLIGLIYLIFIPGILILRILKLQPLSEIKMILYTVGLSLATLMLIGFLMNLIYPYLGISKPISDFLVIITINSIVFVLFALNYLVNKCNSIPAYISVKKIFSPSFLLLCHIPLMAVIGTWLVNFYHNNIILMLMICLISFVVLLISFGRLIPQQLYPFALWSIAISLIYHNTLISMYLNIFDVFIEYYPANLVIINKLWDYNVPINSNAMLSIVSLAPIFNIVCNLDLTWVFKIIYPLIFSLVPVGLYCLFKTKIPSKVAFFSCFLFVSINTFYTIISSTTKQSTAEFFLILIILLIDDKKLNNMIKSFLLVIFSASLVVSHYGTSFLVMFSYIFVLLCMFFFRSLPVRYCRNQLFTTFTDNNLLQGKKNSHSSLSLNFIFLNFCLIMVWYIYISNSSVFNSIVNLGDHIISSIFDDFLDPEASRGLYTFTQNSSSYLYLFAKIFRVIILFFISLGLLEIIIKRFKSNFGEFYIFFSLYWFFICLAAIFVAHFAAMNPPRLYHLAYLFLSPFFFSGGLSFSKYMHIFLKKSWNSGRRNKSLSLLQVFLLINFLFSCGFIFEITNDSPHSISLSQVSIQKNNELPSLGAFYSLYMPEKDVFSSKWLGANRNVSEKIFATLGWGEGYASLVAYGMIPADCFEMLNKNTDVVHEGSYIYLHYVNVVKQIALDRNTNLGFPIYTDMKDVRPLFVRKSKIYDNGGSEILKN